MTRMVLIFILIAVIAGGGWKIWTSLEVNQMEGVMKALAYAGTFILVAAFIVGAIVVIF